MEFGNKSNFGIPVVSNSLVVRLRTAERTTSFLITGDFDDEKLDPQTTCLSSSQLCLAQRGLGQKPMG